MILKKNFISRIFVSIKLEISSTCLIKEKDRVYEHTMPTHYSALFINRSADILMCMSMTFDYKVLICCIAAVYSEHNGPMSGAMDNPWK